MRLIKLVVYSQIDEYKYEIISCSPMKDNFQILFVKLIFLERLQVYSPSYF